MTEEEFSFLRKGMVVKCNFNKRDYFVLDKTSSEILITTLNNLFRKDFVECDRIEKLDSKNAPARKLRLTKEQAIKFFECQQCKIKAREVSVLT